jgi:hypothetical protein
MDKIIQLFPEDSISPFNASWRLYPGEKHIINHHCYAISFRSCKTLIRVAPGEIGVQDEHHDPYSTINPARSPSMTEVVLKSRPYSFALIPEPRYLKP